MMKMNALLKKDTHLFARLNILVYIVLSAWGHMAMNALCVRVWKAQYVTLSKL